MIDWRAMSTRPDHRYSDCLDDLQRLRLSSSKSDLHEKAHEIMPTLRKMLRARGVLTEQGDKASRETLSTSLSRGWRLGDVMALDRLIKDGFVRFAPPGQKAAHW